MKAITVRQPWAWAIATGRKPVENRTWTTRHRGLLAIHAAARWAGPDALRDVCDLADCHVSDVRVTDKHLGAIVAVVDLVDVCTAMLTPGDTCGCGPWAMGGHAHWRVVNPRPLAVPIPCKGRLMLWDLSPELETAVRMQIAPPVVDMRDCRWCNAKMPADHVCPAGAVGCTDAAPDDIPCGRCDHCLAAQEADLACRADLVEHGTPNDVAGDVGVLTSSDSDWGA
ncbi:ASCH domain-containing protein [Nonomuraea wenchangensis]|uniref:ASCH domain-containing protein n=1 Tax=Nonomuraea wenchangensis TaxID=568860 RepID=UPI00331E64CF